MQPYFYLYSILLLIVFLSFTIFSNGKKYGTLNYKIQTNRHNILFYLSCFVIWLFIGTREINVGTDTTTYVNFFNHPRFYYNNNTTDILFEYLARFIHIFSKSNEYFIFSISTIYLAGLFLIVFKLSANKPLSITLFCIVGTSSIFLFSYLSMIRQATALSIYFIGIYLYFEKGRENNKLKFWGVILFISACLIHGSCLFALPILFFVDRIHIPNKVWIVLIILTYVSSALKWFPIGDFLKIIFELLGDDGHYKNYADIDFGLIEDKGWINMNLLPYSIISILLLIMPKKTEINKWYVQLFFYSVILNNLFSDNLMWSRLILYFSIFFIIAIPNILTNQNWYWKIACYSIVFTYFPYKTISQLLFNASFSATGNIVVPYNSWLLNWF